ncbi:MAG TPA: hypothetical protein PKY05_19745, partial [Fibrobacteria bacterium]|nr:hypothetical protein [Fibrobacteria bacterium]
SSKNYGAGGAAMSNVVHGGGVIQAGLPGAGNFSLFGNSDNTVKQSRWYEIKGQESDTGWVIGSNGEFVATLVFDFYSSSYQSSGHYGYGQRLANGNTLITYSGSAKLVEIDPSKNILNVLNGNTIRAYYYPPDHPGIVALGLGSSATDRPRLDGATVRVSGGRILATGLSSGARVRLLDARGAVRHESTAEAGQAALPSEGWANGVYRLQVLQDGMSSIHSIALTR